MLKKWVTMLQDILNQTYAKIQQTRESVSMNNENASIKFSKFWNHSIFIWIWFSTEIFIIILHLVLNMNNIRKIYDYYMLYFYIKIVIYKRNRIFVKAFRVNVFSSKYFFASMLFFFRICDELYIEACKVDWYNYQ